MPHDTPLPAGGTTPDGLPHFNREPVNLMAGVCTEWVSRLVPEVFEVRCRDLTS
jgi:hypothetical protein